MRPDILLNPLPSAGSGPSASRAGQTRPQILMEPITPLTSHSILDGQPWHLLLLQPSAKVVVVRHSFCTPDSSPQNCTSPHLHQWASQDMGIHCWKVPDS